MRERQGRRVMMMMMMIGIVMMVMVRVVWVEEDLEFEFVGWAFLMWIWISVVIWNWIWPTDLMLWIRWIWWIWWIEDIYVCVVSNVHVHCPRHPEISRDIQEVEWRNLRWSIISMNWLGKFESMFATVCFDWLALIAKKYVKMFKFEMKEFWWFVHAMRCDDAMRWCDALMRYYDAMRCDAVQCNVKVKNWIWMVNNVVEWGLNGEGRNFTMKDKRRFWFGVCEFDFDIFGNLAIWQCGRICWMKWRRRWSWSGDRIVSFPQTVWTPSSLQSPIPNPQSSFFSPQSSENRRNWSRTKWVTPMPMPLLTIDGQVCRDVENSCIKCLVWFEERRIAITKCFYGRRQG
jgi:hypothetical protein